MHIYKIAGTFVNHFLVYDEKEVVLIDSGFLGGVSKTRDALTAIGKSFTDISAILLTHGHIDHTFNLLAIKELSNATIKGSEFDRQHVTGTYPYEGISRVCGSLEWAGRKLFGFRATTIDQTVQPGEVIDKCGGLEVVALPGHTRGHLGFRHLPSNILFTGDLVKIGRWRTRIPPPILNTCPHFFKQSIETVLEMDLAGIYPNHGMHASPQQYLAHFRKFGAAYLKRFS